ncbi:GPI-anchored surface protein, putative, partial [Bodo saltans]
MRHVTASSKRPALFAAVALAALLCVTLLVPTAAASSKGLMCQSVWTGPSSENDLMKCITNTNRIQSTAANYVLPALCIVFLILSLLIFPIIFLCCVCCQCCCACCKEVPSGSRSESKNSRKNLVILMVILLGIGVTVIALIITGCTQLRSGAEAVFTNLNKHIVDYFFGVINDLEAATYDNVTGNYTEPFSNSTFDSIRDQITGLQNTTESYHKDLTNYSELAASVGYGLAIFPLFLFSFTFLFACCNCRRCCPSCCTCIYYLIGILFALVGFIMLLMGAIFGDVCA